MGGYVCLLKVTPLPRSACWLSSDKSLPPTLPCTSAAQHSCLSSAALARVFACQALLLRVKDGFCISLPWWHRLAWDLWYRPGPIPKEGTVSTSSRTTGVLEQRPEITGFG